MSTIQFSSVGGTSGGGAVAFDPITTFTFFDDFAVGQINTNDTLGEGWSLQGNGTCSFPATPGSNTIGVVDINSGAVSGNSHGISTGNTGTNQQLAVFPGMVFDFKARFRCSNANASTAMAIGLVNGTGIDSISRGIYLGLIPAVDSSANFKFSLQGDSSNSFTTAIARDTSWHSLRIRSLDGLTLKFSVDGGAETSVAFTSVGGLTAALWLFAGVKTTEAVQKVLEVDYMYLTITGLTR